MLSSELKANSAFCLLLIGCMLLSSCAGVGRDTSTVARETPSMLIYDIKGRDARGEYSGEVVIVRHAAGSSEVDALREVRQADGPVRRFSGSGRIVEGRVVLRFGPLLAARKAPAEIVPKAVSNIPAARETGLATGSLDAAGKTAKIRFVAHTGKRKFEGSETWTLRSEQEAPRGIVHEAELSGRQWNRIDLPVKGPGMIRVTVPQAGAPLGIFLPAGEKPPALKPDPGDDRPLPVLGNTGRSGWPQMQTASGGATWTKQFDEKNGQRHWVFWWRDDQFRDFRRFEFRIDWLPVDWRTFFCNPWVKIGVSPEVVTVGQPIDINVRARAWAGLDMYWWWGAGTGVTALDKAHIQSGGGAVSGDHTWTIQIDRPGTYSFGANARDVAYPELGVPHQASEGCGISYDTVQVNTATHKTYSVAFILLAPQGTDTASPAFQAALDRVNGIKAQLPDQFNRSTDGRGSVDVSYPTVVLTPPGPVYGLEDQPNMWTFVQNTVVNQFYTAHPDDFDFLAIYEVYPDKSIGSRHLTVRTRVAGFGITPFNNAASWGSAGRLRGIGLIKDANEMPDTYSFSASGMHLLLHEVFGHQWGVRAARLQKPGAHFDTGIQSPDFTVLYGRPWVKIDDTHYTTADNQDPATGFTKVIFHPWMLYVAGMKLRSEVPASVLDIEPDTPPASRYDLVTTTGTSETVTLQSVIDESGDRYDVP